MKVDAGRGLRGGTSSSGERRWSGRSRRKEGGIENI